MKDYLVKYQVDSALSTPLLADTFTGLILCIIESLLEDKKFNSLLAAFQKEPPFLFSDGFPAGYLPAPLLESPAPNEEKELIIQAYGDDSLDSQRNGKALLKKMRKTNWVPRETAFSMLKENLPLEKMLLTGKLCPRTLNIRDCKKSKISDCPEFYLDPPDKKIKCKLETPPQFKKTDSTVRTAIDRNTGRVLEGSLFEIESDYYDRSIDFYLRIREEKVAGLEILSLLEKALTCLHYFGYGKYAGIGKGKMTLLDDGISKFSFPQAKNSQSYYVLSTFIPAEQDPTEGLYKIFTKYGKAGNQYSPDKVWKKPAIYLKAGAILKNDGIDRQFMGRAVPHILPGSNITQLAYGLCIGV